MDRESIWQEYRQKEVQLEERREELAHQQQKLTKLQEEYEQHFFDSKRLFMEIRESTSLSRTSGIFEGIETMILKEQESVLRQFSDEKDAMKKEVHAIMQQHDDLFYEQLKQEQLLDEEGAT